MSPVLKRAGKPTGKPPKGKPGPPTKPPARSADSGSSATPPMPQNLNSALVKLINRLTELVDILITEYKEERS